MLNHADRRALLISCLRLTSLPILSLAPAAGLLSLAGCAPRFNWREVRDPEGRWMATFPDKPVQVTRDLPLGQETGSDDQPILTRLSLWAARVDELQFSVGLAQPLPLDKTSPKALAQLQDQLESAMLRNLQADPESVVRSSSGVRRRIFARGQMPADARGSLIPARMALVTAVLAEEVIEAVVIGPEADFPQEAAEQFLSALRIGAEVL